MRNPSPGFSLLESMIVVGILAIVSAIAFPSFRALVEDGRATRAANQVHALLMAARTHAVTHQKRVTLCRTLDGETCVFGGAWSGRTIVFIDQRPNGVRDADEPIIGHFSGPDVKPYHVVSVGHRPHIGFNPDGRMAGTNLTLRICDPRLNTRRLVVVSVSGRVRATRDVAAHPRCGNDPPSPT